MEINRKAVFFTTFFLILSLVLILNLTIMWKQYVKEQQQKELVRINVLNDFVKNFNQDLEKASYVATFRSFLALEDYIAKKGFFFTNLSSNFAEVFTNGTINGTFMEIMNESYLNYYLLKVSNKANLMGVFLNATIKEVNISQADAWTIKTDMLIHVKIKDKKGIAKWEYDKEVTTLVPIIGLRDPLFSVNSHGRLFRSVKKSSFSEFVVNGNVSNLQEFIDQGYYIENNDAPSFIMRFTNNLSPSPNGIESLVNLQAFYDQDLDVRTHKSIVDHLYFNNESYQSNLLCNIEGLDSWVKIDVGHNQTYEINELNYTIC